MSTTTTDVRQAGARVEYLLDELAATGEPGTRARAEELVRLLVGLYGAGLERIVDMVTGHLDDPDSFGELLAADELVASLLVLHGLHPHDVERRVRAALVGLGARAGGARLLAVDDDGVAHLRLHGGGCGTADLRRDIEAAITASVGDVTAVIVEEAPKLIPVASLFADPAVHR